MLLYGAFYAAGRDAGNYMVQAKLQRSLGEKIGNLELGFQNINRSPSRIFTDRTAFPVLRLINFNNENVTSISGSLFFNKWKVRATGEYFLQSNYTYFSDFRTAAQYKPLFNFLRVGISRETLIGKHWHWYLDLYFQSVAQNVPINLPWLYARSRFAYEGRPFRNLILSTGLDVRYFSPFKANGYSPLTGQFFFQDQRQIANRPDVTAFMHFRIRSFTSFVRLENLNTATTQYGFGFKRNNIASPLYPTPEMLFRLGIFWNFVN